MANPSFSGLEKRLLSLSLEELKGENPGLAGLAVDIAVSLPEEHAAAFEEEGSLYSLARIAEKLGAGSTRKERALANRLEKLFVLCAEIKQESGKSGKQMAAAGGPQEKISSITNKYNKIDPDGPIIRGSEPQAAQKVTVQIIDSRKFNENDKRQEALLHDCANSLINYFGVDIAGPMSDFVMGVEASAMGMVAGNKDNQFILAVAKEGEKTIGAISSAYIDTPAGPILFVGLISVSEEYRGKFFGPGGRLLREALGAAMKYAKQSGKKLAYVSGELEEYWDLKSRHPDLLPDLLERVKLFEGKTLKLDSTAFKYGQINYQDPENPIPLELMLKPMEPGETHLPKEKVSAVVNAIYDVIYPDIVPGAKPLRARILASIPEEGVGLVELSKH